MNIDKIRERVEGIPHMTFSQAPGTSYYKINFRACSNSVFGMASDECALRQAEH